MQIRIADHAGFCYGVKAAVQTAVDACAEKGAVWTLGSLIHNNQVMQSLHAQGVRVAQCVDDIPEGSTVIVRSHGISPAEFALLGERNVTIVDATCPNVGRVHRLVAEYSADGSDVIIAGKAEHPEVIATAGWCNGPVWIVQNGQEAQALGKLDKALLVAQTTLTQRTWEEIAGHLQTRIPLLTVQNTICAATGIRQREAAALAQQVDVMLVVGGRDSANTRALYETCCESCNRTVFLESAAELPLDEFSASDIIGITAGASTPDWSLKEVATRMNDMEQNNRQDAVEQAPDTEPVTSATPPAVEATEPAQAPDAPLQEAPVAQDPPPSEASAQDTSAVEETPSEAGEPQAPAAPEASPSETGEPQTAAAPEASPSEADAQAPAEEDTIPAADSAVQTTADTDAAKAPEATPADSAESSFMADIEATLVTIRPGQTITGTVVQITDDEVCVNIGFKSDGLISRSELVTTDVKVGDEIDVEVVKVNDGEGNVVLSQRNIVNRRNWDALMAQYERGEYVEGVGKEAVKGGLIANVGGVRAFIPASHLSQRYVERIEDFVGKDIKLKIIEVDKQKKRIVASRKAVILEEAASRKREIWEKLVEGEIIAGIVRRLTDFGAFVDIGGVDGLVHVTDLSWGRVRHPSDIVSPNQEISVKILSLDPERERIQLGYKQTQPRPWDVAEEKYPVGSIVEGKVVRITSFGAFVELEPGLDGLVHISQCALTRIGKVEDAVQVGQIVRVKVLGVDPAAKRISLSIRAALEDDAFNYSDEIPGDDLYDDTGTDEYATPVDYSQLVEQPPEAEA